MNNLTKFMPEVSRTPICIALKQAILRHHTKLIKDIISDFGK
jgi:hypothetical protein